MAAAAERETTTHGRVVVVFVHLLSYLTQGSSLVIMMGAMAELSGTSGQAWAQRL